MSCDLIRERFNLGYRQIKELTKGTPVKVTLESGAELGTFQVVAKSRKSLKERGRFRDDGLDSYRCEDIKVQDPRGPANVFLSVKQESQKQWRDVHFRLSED